MKLGERLQAIAAMVPAGSIVADIGTDHAYLPIHLVAHAITPQAIAGDLHQGPYLSAKNAVAAAQLEQQIAVRQGNGLAVLRPGEAATVVIAGMGGLTIIDILCAKPEITATLKRLILQPMIAAAQLRNWLQTNDWQIVAEQLVQEDGKLYQIIAAEPGKSQPVAPVFQEIGPLLWQTKHPLLRLHIEELAAHLHRVLASMGESPRAITSVKYQEFSHLLTELEDKLKCL